MPETDRTKETAGTRRLYFDDAYRREFDAAVLEKSSHEGFPALVLDETCFYPESGGQPWDRGTLDGIDVLKVIDLDGIILHVLKEDLTSPKVHGRIDWPTRFDHMQQHTGQHILSQAFFEILKGETLSFHLGEDVSTLEISLKTITDADLDRIEDRANATVWEDREVKTYFVPEERIGEIPLRKPPKKQGLLRVVEVSGYDYSACGGTHCRRTGEVGLIKATAVEKIRGNIRFDFLCGARALGDYRLKDRNVLKIAGLFSSLPKDTAGQVERLSADFKAQRKRLRKLEERLAFFDAQEVIRGARGRIVSEVLEDKTPEEARFLALNIIRHGEFIVLYAVPGESQSHLIIARSDSLDLDVRALVPVIGAVIVVKGGGGPSLVELVTAEKEKLPEAVDTARTWLEEHEGKTGGSGV